jgi:glycosyltransferase involved in cell wall biosynthesis
MNKVVAETELISSRQAESLGSRRVCIVTWELAGPHLNGGIGTTNRALALVLRTLGYEVDILYTNVHEGKPVCVRGTFADQVEVFRDLSVSLKCLNHSGSWYDWPAISYRSLQHLIRYQYELVFFDDLFGTGYYPLLARRTGNAQLRSTVMCVTTHSATQWISELNYFHPLTRMEELRLTEMERRSIELADAVKSPSAYILKKYRDYGWRIPENTIVLPNFVSGEQAVAQSRKHGRVDELVFFGRLETRKGLWMFCAALDRLKYQLEGRRVTFLGKTTVENNNSTAGLLLKRSASWPFSVRIITNFDRDQALRYLKRDGRLAVMPSPEDNSPSTILECIDEGVPFIACSGSGGEELIDERSRKINLFEPTVEGLCAKILETFERGGFVARPSFDQAQLRNSFAEWLERIINDKTDPINPLPKNIGPANPILLILVPTGFPADHAAAEILRTLNAYEGKIEVKVLTSEPTELLDHLKLSSGSSTIIVTGPSDFGVISRTIASGQPTIVGLCHITQLLGPTWVERARACFEIDEGISAVTGMVGSKKEANTRVREPYVSTADEEHTIEQYLTGFAPPLFALSQETNGGFVLMRSGVFSKCCDLSPIDEQYDRLKRMQDWIHEILVTLHRSGERFELLPDEVSEQVVQERSFEVFRSADFMRSLSQQLYNYIPGSDHSVLAGLAIDTGLLSARSVAQEKYFREIEGGTGKELVRLPPWSSMLRQIPQLASIAHAGGQIELAIDLCTSIVVDDLDSKPTSLIRYVHSAAANEVVDLVEAASASYSKIGFQNEPRLFDESGARKIEMEVNAKLLGLAAITFKNLDLSKINYFNSTIEVPDKAAGPVRFKVELIAEGKQREWSTEKVVRGGEGCVWEFEIPIALRGRCGVLIGVEMADWESSSGALACWMNARFRRQTAGGSK